MFSSNESKAVRELGRLMREKPQIVLRIPEAYEFLDWLVSKGNDGVLGRLLLEAGRGRRLQSYCFVVGTIDAIVARENCSVARACRIAERPRIPTRESRPRLFPRIESPNPNPESIQSRIPTEVIQLTPLVERVVGPLAALIGRCRLRIPREGPLLSGRDDALIGQQTQLSQRHRADDRG
jgi:hypothetical protein